MLPKEELERWLGTLPAGTMVGIDEGGLTLSVKHVPHYDDADDGETLSPAYLEVGGLVTDEETE